MPRGTFEYIGDCRSLDGDSINAMKASAVQVSLHTIRRRCHDFADWCHAMGYTRAFPISKDWHVGYSKGAYRGTPCYYVTWSAFEHVWTLEEALNAR